MQCGNKMRIESREKLKFILAYERKIYVPDSLKEYLIFVFTKNERWLIYKYLKYLRLEEYYLCKGSKYRLIFYLYSRKKNMLGNKINIKIMPLYTSKGLNIHHKNIVINGYVGEDCVFHGNNCIGNVNKSDSENEKIPRIMNRVNFGYGSIVIGDIFVNDDVQIGAGAVVVKDIHDRGISVVGVPAHSVEINK